VAPLLAASDAWDVARIVDGRAVGMYHGDTTDVSDFEVVLLKPKK
jgi:hypothetical protein